VLLLFDVDGTLLRGAHVEHRDALHAALREVHGIADPAAVPIQAPGRTDGELARLIALASGVSPEAIDEGADAVREACCAAYARLCRADLASTVVEGVPELLERLAARGEHRLALLTGNYEAVARLKLDRAGIGRFFERGQGGFGSDHEDRTELPAVARRRAGRRGAPHPRELTVVIGDTPLDVACARADGVRCLGVATGPFPPDELTAADAVAADAAELGRLIDGLA
jgi:phosphoglycolate phosphatase